MSKLTKQDKINIYNYWKNYDKSSIRLSKKYGVNSSNISYMLNLIDRYRINNLDRSILLIQLDSQIFKLSRDSW